MPPRSRVTTVERVTKAEARRRLKDNIVNFIAEQTVQGLGPKAVSPLVEKEFQCAFPPDKVSDYKHRYVTPVVLEAARQRLAKGILTTAKPPRARATSATPETTLEVPRPHPTGAETVPSCDGALDKVVQRAHEFADMARDPDLFLGRIAEVFYTTTDSRILVQAASILASVCGHTKKNGDTGPDEELLAERAERIVQRAMAATGKDRETVVREISQRSPEFARWARPTE